MSVRLKVVEPGDPTLPQDKVAVLEERIKLLEAVIDNFPGGIILTDKDLNVVVCNRQQRALLEYPDSLFDGQNPSLRELFHFNAARGEYGPGEVTEIVASKMELVRRREAHAYERRRPNGQIIEIRGVPLASGGFVTSYNDVSENRKHQALIADLALTDPLTGLANRRLLREHFQQAIARAKRGEGFAVHYIDLDRFKPINDTYGHDAGDAVLSEVANRLRSTIRDTDTVARIGGDEFVILQSKAKTQRSARDMADRIRTIIAKPILFKDKPLLVGASIGIALSGRTLNDMDELLRRADAALYHSKQSGRNRVSFYQMKADQRAYAT